MLMQSSASDSKRLSLLVRRPLGVCAVLLCVALFACSPGRDTNSVVSSTPPKPPPITTKTFEPVYRAAKSIEGAARSGVSYVKFSELLQALSTELGIARDQKLNETDRKLLTLFDEVYEHYKASSLLWHMKIEMSDDLWKDEIPFQFSDKADPSFAALIKKYDLSAAERKVPYTGTRYRALAADSIQRVWASAETALKTASDLYYGRETS
jgi:hypothetical protein